MAGNEYHRVYNLKRYHRIRKEIIDLLGGKCVECGTTENLEFDHIDRETKNFNIGRLTNVSREKLLKELPLCQLLCKPHHDIKSAKEESVEHGGGLTGKKNCRCEYCAPLKNAYARRYKANAG